MNVNEFAELRDVNHDHDLALSAMDRGGPSIAAIH